MGKDRQREEEGTPAWWRRVAPGHQGQSDRAARQQGAPLVAANAEETARHPQARRVDGRVFLVVVVVVVGFAVPGAAAGVAWRSGGGGGARLEAGQAGHATTLAHARRHAWSRAGGQRGTGPERASPPASRNRAPAGPAREQHHPEASRGHAAALPHHPPVHPARNPPSRHASPARRRLSTGRQRTPRSFSRAPHPAPPRPWVSR